MDNKEPDVYSIRYKYINHDGEMVVDYTMAAVDEHNKLSQAVAYYKEAHIKKAATDIVVTVKLESRGGYAALH